MLFLTNVLVIMCVQMTQILGVSEMAVQTKNTRIDIRLNPQDKATLEAAAALKRTSVSSYILSVAIDAAKLDIEKEEIVILNAKQRDTILSLLENPPKPVEALRRLFK